MLRGTVDVRVNILFLCDSSHVCAIACCEIHSNGLQERRQASSHEKKSAGGKTKRNRLNERERQKQVAKGENQKRGTKTNRF